MLTVVQRFLAWSSSASSSSASSFIKACTLAYARPHHYTALNRGSIEFVLHNKTRDDNPIINVGRAVPKVIIRAWWTQPSR